MRCHMTETTIRNLNFYELTLCLALCRMTLYLKVLFKRIALQVITQILKLNYLHIFTDCKIPVKVI